MRTIETERLIIRNFKISDSQALREMICQYEASEYAVYDQQWPTSQEDITKVTEWFASGDNYFAVCLKDTGRFIGFVNINKEEKENKHEFNLGYIFNFDYHNKGYATEACRAVINHTFIQLQADNIITGTGALNIPSCRLLERLGFKKTSESIGSFRNTLDGNPIEFLGYSYTLSRDEWKAAVKPA